MTAPFQDGYECIRELIQALRAENFGVTAAQLDTLLKTPWTTSSELLGELWGEIIDFQRCGYDPLSPELRRSLETCLSEIRRAMPNIRYRPPPDSN